LAENIFVGSVPSCVVFCLLPTTALLGNLNKNPYSFDVHNLERISVIVETESGTQTQEIINDPANGLYLDAYRSIVGLTKSRDYGNYLSRTDIVNGSMFYAFYLAPKTTSMTMQPYRRGQVKCELKFKSTNPDSLVLVALAQYDQILKFDNNRTFTFD